MSHGLWHMQLLWVLRFLSFPRLPQHAGRFCLPVLSAAGPAASLVAPCPVLVRSALGLLAHAVTTMADWFRWHGRAVAKCAHLWFAWRHHATAKLDPTSTKLRRAAVLDVVQCYPWYLKYVSAELRADPEVVMAAVKHGGYALQYASVGLRADRDIVLEAMQQYAGHPKYRERLRFVARATSIIVSCGLICGGGRADHTSTLRGPQRSARSASHGVLADRFARGGDGG